MQINQEIVEDLHRLIKADNAAPVPTPISFLPVVPGMMQCYIAQLEQIGEEYQQVFSQIHIQLNGIRQYSDFIAGVSADQLNSLKSTPVLDTAYKHRFAFLLRLAAQLQVEAAASIVQLNNNDAFEQLLKDTIDQLSNIGQKAPIPDQEAGPSKLAATIKHIEKVYTMESERVIYNHVFQAAYPTKETNSADIELF
jgi:hypothetical protein